MPQDQFSSPSHLMSHFWIPTYSNTVVSLEIRSSFAESDVLARNLIRTFIAACEAEACKRSLSHDFKYLNYADADQEIGVFSNGQRKRLKAVMKRYDPEEWLRTRLTGPFKL